LGDIDSVLLLYASTNASGNIL